MRNHAADQRTLLVMGPGPLSHSGLNKILSEVRSRTSSGGQLDLLMFREDADGSIASQVRSGWEGQLQELSGADYLDRVDEAVRDSVSVFVTDLRERLGAIALATGGPTWAARFGSLWWKTQISEKNSPGDGVWWQLFRAAALRERLRERAYSRCAVAGDDDFVRLAKQVADLEQVPLMGFPQGGERLRLHRVLLARAAGCLFLLIAIILAKWHHRRDSRQMLRRPAREGQTILYTWFPRVWTDRFGGWKDMYYGDAPELIAEETGDQPLMALRMYDRTKFVTPGTYHKRLKVLQDPQRAPRRYVLLESFGRLWETLRLYLSPWDGLRYLRMTRHRDYRQAFLWEGLELGTLLNKGIWRSLLLSWPHLLALQGNATRLAQQLEPALVVLYCFEFVYGRSIIAGTRNGVPDATIVGVQHGPISPMKLLYSGTAAERRPSHSGGPALPEPDVYAVDGALAETVLVQRGIPDDRIEVTGPARFDDVWAEAARLQSTDGHRTSDKLRILVAPGLHDTPFVFGTTLGALGHDDRLELVLKPHPKVSDEQIDLWTPAHQGAGQYGGARVTVAREGSIYEWMARTDIFLGTYSSTSVEALAFRLPVILLVPDHTPDMSLYHGQSVPVLKASSAEGIRRHVARFADDASFREPYAEQISKVLEDSFGPRDSQASQRLARLCAETAARSVAAVQKAETL